MVKLEIYKPAVQLSQYINSYAFASGILLKTTFRPLPNGSSELIFYFSNVPELHEFDKKEIKNYKSFIGGQMSDQKHVVVVNYKEFNCLSVFLTYTGFYKLFGIPQVIIRDSVLQMECLLGNDSKLLDELLALSKSNEERVKKLDNYFSKKFLNKVKEVNPSIKEAIYSICKNIGRVKVQQLIKDLTMSERAFERNFKYIIGLTCKEFIDTIRFKNIFSNLSLIGKGKRWIDLIEDFGYHDQSHFIKDLKRYTDLTPHELLKKHDEYVYGSRVYLSQ